MTPPFRAEHVGSLLRPEKLLQARAAAEGDQYRQATGPLHFEQLEGDRRRGGARRRCACRRTSACRSSPMASSAAAPGFRISCWRCPAPRSPSSIRRSPRRCRSRTTRPSTSCPGTSSACKSRLTREKGIFTEHFKFLQAQTKRTPKISLPSPTMLHFWGGRAAIDATVYPGRARVLGRRGQDLGRGDRGSPRSSAAATCRSTT